MDSEKFPVRFAKSYSIIVNGEIWSDHMLMEGD